MNQFVQSLPWRVAVQLVCALLVFAGAAVTSCSPSDMTIQQPTAVAAPSAPPPA